MWTFRAKTTGMYVIVPVTLFYIRIFMRLEVYSSLRCYLAEQREICHLKGTTLNLSIHVCYILPQSNKASRNAYVFRVRAVLNVSPRTAASLPDRFCSVEARTALLYVYTCHPHALSLCRLSRGFVGHVQRHQRRKVRSIRHTRKDALKRGKPRDGSGT